jgi:nicotinamidase-related amidase
MEHALGFDIPENLQDVCHPSRTCLLVYDMQVGIVAQIADGPLIVERVASLLQQARAAGIRVVYSRHYAMPLRWAGVFQLRMAKSWQRVQRVSDLKSHLLLGSPEWEIHPAVAPQPGDAVIDKITMSAFEGTPLPILLRDLGLVSFLVAGIALEVGIEPTARHAADLGFIPVLVEDACGFGNREAAQRSLAALRYAGDALFTDVASLGKILRP